MKIPFILASASAIALMAPDRFPADLLAEIDADLAKISAK